MRKLRVALITLLGALVCVFAALGVAACNKEPEVTTYTVTFVYDDGGVTQNREETVNDGDTVAKPVPNPTRDGYVFAEWYNGATQYDFTQSVTSNLTLTAHWAKDVAALTWTANEATEYVYEGTLPTSVEKGTSVSFEVKKINPFYKDDIVVTAGGAELTPVNGVYTFTADAAKTIAVSITEDTDAMTGTGTETDPYVISSAYQLKTFSDLVNSEDTCEDFFGAYVELGADIDYCGYEFAPIGNNLGDEFEAYFGEGAQFDGKGYTISNIKFASEHNTFGLFGTTFLAVVKNVNIDGMAVDTEFTENRASMIGGIVAYSLGSDIINCSVKGSVVAKVNLSNVTLHVGSIVGFMTGIEGGVSATVQYCTGEINIQTNGDDPIYAAGGIVGSALGGDSRSPSNIFNCVANVTMSGEITLAGGIVGQLMNDASVTNCFSQGVVRANDASNSLTAAGVIAGLAFNDSVIANCYSFATKTENGPDVNFLVTDSTEICGKYFAAGYDDIDSRKVLVRNVYKALPVGIVVDGPNLNSKETVLQNLKWNENEWTFYDVDDVKYPSVKYVEEVDFGVTLNFSGKQVNYKVYEDENSEEFVWEPQATHLYEFDQCIPVSWIFQNMAQSELLATDGCISYGVYFDAELTIPVPAAYMLTGNETFYVGFADYSAFTGEYQAKYGSVDLNFSFKNDELIYIYISINGGPAQPCLFVYEDTNKIRIVEPGFFTGDGDYYATFDRINNTMTLADFGGADLVGYLKTTLIGEWFDSSNALYNLNYDFNGSKTPEGGTAQSLTYRVDVQSNAVTITIGEDILTGTYNAADSTITLEGGNVLTKLRYDEFRGVWESEYNNYMSISINGRGYDGHGKITIGQDVYDYTVDDKNVLSFVFGSNGTITAEFDENGFLNFGGITMYGEGSFKGKWIDTRYPTPFVLTLNGIGKDGIGTATDSMGYDLTYNAKWLVDSNSGNPFLRVTFYTSKGQIANGNIIYNAALSNGTVVGDLLIITYGSGENAMTFQLACLDEFEGDWQVAPTGCNETKFSFSGLGAYGLKPATPNSWSCYGFVTISAKNGDEVTEATVDYTYTYGGTGTFEYNDKTYVMQYVARNGSEAVYIFEGEDEDASFILYKVDRYAGMHFSGNAVDVTFDGKSSSAIGLKGIATVNFDDGYYIYDVDADGNVILYNLSGTQFVPAYVFELKANGLLEFKKVTGGNPGATLDTLGQYSVLNRRQLEGSGGMVIIISYVDVDGEARGYIYWDEDEDPDLVTFTYSDAESFLFEWDNTEYLLMYDDEYNAALMYDWSTFELFEVFAILDDFYGLYSSNNDMLLMDGWGTINLPIDAEATLLLNGEIKNYIYVISEDGEYAILYSAGGTEDEPAYIVYLEQPEDEGAIEFTSSSGKSVWLVAVEAEEGEAEAED